VRDIRKEVKMKFLIGFCVVACIAQGILASEPEKENIEQAEGKQEKRSVPGVDEWSGAGGWSNAAIPALPAVADYPATAVGVGVGVSTHTDTLTTVREKVPVPIDRPIPYPVAKPFPVEVVKHVDRPYPVPAPYPVVKTVPQPFPVEVVKHV
jgi:hypothetical protein